MPARPVIEKTKDLLDDIPDRLPFLASPQGGKATKQNLINIDPAQITNKQGQSSSACKCVIRHFHLADFTLASKCNLLHNFLTHWVIVFVSYLNAL